MTKLAQSAYIHLPFCRRRCFYCDFPITVLGDRATAGTINLITEYVEILCQEIKITPSAGLPLETIFFGGGTPSLVPVSQLESILIALDNHFGIKSDAEISMEIDPGTFNREQIQGYQQIGINRFSLGIQAFQDQLLQACGRSHNSHDIINSIELIREIGITNLSFDLISGLPHQTPSQWQESLTTAINLQPDHISCYDLVLEPVTAFGKRFQPGETPLPTDELTAQMYRLAHQQLTAAGFNHYEISNYAQSGFECRHNLVYWHNQPYYGFGMGATSYTNHQRFNRPRTRREYYLWVEQLSHNQGIIDYPATSDLDQLLETIMLGLRLAQGIDLGKLLRQFPVKNIDKLLNILNFYQEKDLLHIYNLQRQQLFQVSSPNVNQISTVKLQNPEGFLFSNTIIADLFEVLESKE